MSSGDAPRQLHEHWHTRTARLSAVAFGVPRCAPRRPYEPGRRQPRRPSKPPDVSPGDAPRVDRPSGPGPGRVLRCDPSANLRCCRASCVQVHPVPTSGTRARFESPSAAELDDLISNSTSRLREWSSRRLDHIGRAFAATGLCFPPDSSTPDDQIDGTLKSVMSAFIRRTRMQLAQFVELWRFQTRADYRPNKAIEVDVVSEFCKNYPHLHHLVTTASEGIHVQLRDDVDLHTRPRQPANHASAVSHLPVLLQNVRREQDAGRYLVVDLDILSIWDEIVLSPFGVVAKADRDITTSGRTIHDLSFPVGHSVNEATARDDTPPPKYEPCVSVAKRVLAASIGPGSRPAKLQGGDVATAFRHVALHSDSVYLFGGTIPEANALIIDLFAPFGWTLSPAEYEIYGGAISYIHGSTICSFSLQPFYSYHWVDDHVNVVSGPQEACDEADRSLRRAMTVVLGPYAVNEDKFTNWHHRLKVLGIIFDSVTCTVSMPSEKIAKARLRIMDAHQSASLSITELRSLLGSLRHVATCVRPARAFLQRLRGAQLGHARTHRLPVSSSMREDLLWWLHILASDGLNGVPLQYFADEPPADVVVYMDASNYGLCALDITRRHCLTYSFSSNERILITRFQGGEDNGFDINFRELLSLAYAVHTWGPSWQRPRPFPPVHVRFHIDNVSAVTWQTRMCSRNPRAQTIIRLLALWEVSYNLRFSSRHVAGRLNHLADMGSRIAQDAVIARRFYQLTASWVAMQITSPPSTFETIWQGFSASIR